MFVSLTLTQSLQRAGIRAGARQAQAYPSQGFEQAVPARVRYGRQAALLTVKRSHGAAARRSLFTLRSAGVTEGSMAPDFTLLDQNGEAVTLSKLRGKPVVLAFYPAASSPGCTKELCAFRDDLAAFESVDAVVLGISSNTVEEQKRFSEAQGYRFRLLADVGGKVRKLYGVPNTLGVLPGRVTYVIDKEGKVVKVHNSQMDFLSHVEEAKRALALMRS
jgi:peroxiredoxin Q/BCP